MGLPLAGSFDRPSPCSCAWSFSTSLLPHPVLECVSTPLAVAVAQHRSRAAPHAPSPDAHRGSRPLLAPPPAPDPGPLPSRASSAAPPAPQPETGADLPRKRRRGDKGRLVRGGEGRGERGRVVLVPRCPWVCSCCYRRTSGSRYGAIQCAPGVPVYCTVLYCMSRCCSVYHGSFMVRVHSARGYYLRACFLCQSLLVLNMNGHEWS